MELDESSFSSLLHVQEGQKIQDFLYKTYTGISPIMAAEICHEAKLDASDACEQMTAEKEHALFTAFSNTMEQVKAGAFSPAIYYQKPGGKILDFGVLPMTQFDGLFAKAYPSVSALLEGFYTERDNAAHIRQKAHDTRRLVMTNIERCVKKKDIQLKTLRDVAGKDKWKLKGELITANIYAIPPMLPHSKP